jgi:hypothetical protein
MHCPVPATIAFHGSYGHMVLPQYIAIKDLDWVRHTRQFFFMFLAIGPQLASSAMEERRGMYISYAHVFLCMGLDMFYELLPDGNSISQYTPNV